jgi:two-component system, sensor histidine kinase and response regulator
MVRALIVDDDPVSARVVGKCLERAGHEVTVRTDGRSGLEAALAEPPDLIILDVMMPGMDGLEVCSALSAAEATRDVPIIFVSACGELGDRVRGLDHGADDYLVKPVTPDDLLARVRAALRTKMLQDELHQALAELRQVGHNRQELVSMLAHDIRGLLGAVSSAVEMARLDLDDLPRRDSHRFLDIAERNTSELVELTTNLLDTYRLEEGRLRPRVQIVNLAALVEDVVERLDGQARFRDARVVVAGDGPESVLGDRDLLERVLVNLVTNALKFSPVGTTITIELGSELVPPNGSPGIVVAVRDEGPGIPVDEREHLFERFTPLALPSGKRPVGSGLGLSFCHKVIALMGGEIWVESVPGHGSTFAFVLPAAASGIRPYGERASSPKADAETGAGRSRVTSIDAAKARAAAIIPFRNDRSTATK